MRASAIAFTTVMLCARPALAFGQPTQCVATAWGSTEYRGECVRNDVRVGSFSVRPVADRPRGLWRGLMLRPSDSLPMTVDTRPGGSLQLGRRWLALTDAHADSATLRFAYHDGVSKPAGQDDLEILRRTRQYLDDPVRWDRADTTDMAAAPIRGFSCAPAPKQSLFCALYLASIAVTGDYAHFRPAVEAVRGALTRVSRKQYRHPLVEFNNDPDNTIRDIHRALELAIQLVEAQRVKRR